MIHTLKTFQQKIESEFWKFVIPRMKNQPELVGKVMQIGLFVRNIILKQNKFIQALFWIILGLTLGLGIGVLIGGF